MKKRLLSIFLVMVMVLSLAPASIFADEAGVSTCICETSCTSQDMNDDCPVCGAEGALPENCGQYIAEDGASDVTLTLLLPAGLSADGMEAVDESTYKVTRTVKDGSIIPITIFCEDEGAFSAELAEQINENSSISDNGLNVTYDSENNTLTISGSPIASVELDMNSVLTTAMEEMGAYETVSTDVHTHCICGGSVSTGNHKHDTAAHTWTEWDGTSDIKYIDNVAYLYLSDNATLSSMLTVTDGYTLNLCLNGKTLSCAETVIEVKGNATLNICDCSSEGTGAIASTDSSEYCAAIKVSPNSAGNATLNLYSGEVSGSVNGNRSESDIGTIKLNNTSDNTAVFNMYGGTVKNSHTSSHTAAAVCMVDNGVANINIYGGSVISTGTGIYPYNNSTNNNIHIAGGTIEGGWCAVYYLAQESTLTMSGSPTLKAGGGKWSDYGDIALSDTTFFSIADDFAPTEAISVNKSVDSSGSVLIAKSAGDYSLADKEQYFSSNKDGYFVESKDNDLYLTTCAITAQPAADNNYTVTAVGNPSYQWYSATSGDIAVTEANATCLYDCSYWNGKWIFSTPSVSVSQTLYGFKLHMNEGDTLKITLTEPSRLISNFQLKGSTSLIIGETQDNYNYTFTATADDDYTLVAVTSASYDSGYEDYLHCEFTATVSADVADDVLDGQTAATLNTAVLSAGKYLCAVTWEDKTTLYSNAVDVSAPTHTHCVCGDTSCEKTDGGHSGKSTEWQPWDGVSSIDYGSTKTAYVYLTQSVERNTQFKVESGNTLYLCLNGKTITNKGNYYAFEAAGNLTITDCNKTAGSIICKTNYGVIVDNGGAFTLWNGSIAGKFRSVDNAGTFIMNGGSITASDEYGVYNRGGKFTMNGGSITGCGKYGVFNQGSDATFTMAGGTISGNTAQFGGGVWSSGTFTMTGGTISGNTAESYGGGVYNYGTFYLKGGTISGNTSANNGGGVYNDGTFNMSGNPQITGNVKGGTIEDGTLKAGTGTPNNVCLISSDKIITVDTLGMDSTARVGITVQMDESFPTVVNNSTDTGVFTSDDNNYALVPNGSNGLKIEEAHRHCVCGKSDCETGEGHDATAKWTAVSSLDQITGDGNYYLTADVTLTETWNVSNTVSLCLNGKKIIGASGLDVINVKSSGKLTITDCTTDSTRVGKITHNEGAKGRGIDNSGTLALWNGKISGNTTSQTDANGAGVRNDGTFTMHDGVISGNSIGSGMWSGGGVYNNYNAKFTMTGGSITGNTGFYSGGVGNSGIFDISGGSITGNKTTQTSNCGGGVWNYGTFNLSGNVNITGNTMSNGKANNVFPYSTASINVNGNLDESARVGVYKEAAGTIVVTGSTNTTIFTSDSDNYELVADNGNLKWMAVHRHCVCGKATAEGDNHTHETTTTWTPWTSTDSLPTQAGSYYLMQSVTLSGTWTVSSDVNLCLNGKLIIGADGNNTITVDSGSTLNITDCQTTGSITHATDTTGRGIYNNGKLTFWKGSISGNRLSNSGSGGGVYNGGTFTMYGGSITDNYACDYGGGVYNYADGYTFTMTGGTIARNKSYEGGGVYTGPNATFKMSGGVIGGDSADDGNIADSNGDIYDGNGGGVSNDGGIFIMSGNAKISYNTASGSGGGVYYDCYNGASINSVFELSGNAEISHNAAGSNGTGGGVYSYGKVNMTGGSIVYNTAKTAGGICSSGNYTFTMSGGNITGNTATYYGGVFNNSGNFNMTGGSITKNAANEGGGVRNMGTFTMTGGSITANNVSSKGGGIQNSGTLKMSGAVTVSGNTNGSAANNVYLAYGKTITVDTAGMDNTARVGINVQDSESLPTVVTGSTNTNVFSSDSADYKLVDNNDSGLKLANQEVTIRGVTLLNEDGGAAMADSKKVYDGKAVAYEGGTYEPSVTGSLTYTWQVKKEGSETYTNITDNIAPKDAGSYRLLVEFKRGETVLGSANYDFTISKAELTIENLAVADKPYDGTNTATITGTPSLSGLVGDETVTLTNGTPTFSSVNAGNDIDISFTDFSIEGAAAKNYTLIQPTGIKANINKKALTITGANVEAKTYNGTADASVTEVFFSGLQNGETLAFNMDYTVSDAAYDSPNASGDNAATKVNFTVTLKDTEKARNYVLASHGGEQSASIGKASKSVDPLSITGKRGKENSYVIPTNCIVDGGFVSVSYVTDESGILYGMPSFSEGRLNYSLTDKANELQSAVVVLNVVSDNYNDYNITVNIGVAEKEQVTINITAGEYTYNGSPQTPTDITVVDDKMPVGELYIYYTGCDETAYDSKDAPTDAGSYMMTVSVLDSNLEYRGSSNCRFEIKKKSLHMTAVAQDKTYDGNNIAALVAALDESDVVTEDEVILATDGVTATFDSKNCGVRKGVTISGEYTIKGADANNYILIQPEGSAADINKKSLTVKNLIVADKIYDGTNEAKFDIDPELDGVVEPDNVILVNGIPSFTSIYTGENIPISFTEFTLDGTDKDNYYLIQPSDITANIISYVSDKSEYTVNSNDWLNEDFVIKAVDGWQLSYTNTADGIWVDELAASQENNSGTIEFYLKNTTSGIISEKVTETYKIDNTAPTGEIRIDKRNAWQEFVHTITFGIFYKDAQTVKITAEDGGSGVKTIEYFVTAEDLTIEGLAGKNFTIYANAFGIEPNDKLIAYAKLTDVAGNVTYLRSDGVVLDGTAPVINGADNGKTYCEAVTLTITDEYLDTVTVNGKAATLAEDGKLTVNPTEGKQTIIATDKAGNSTSITITVNDGHTWGEWTQNDDETHTRICKFDVSHTQSGDCHGGKATCKDKAICEDCKQSYGSLDESNHTNLVHVEAKAPTTSTEGNKEYWYCDGCGKYFSNEESTQEIKEADTVIKKLPVITHGDNAEVTDGEKQSLTFTSDAEFDDFIRVEVDGNTVDESNYTVKAGSTIVTLNADYVATLSVGEHTLGIVSQNGTATAKFTVNKKAVEPTPTPDDKTAQTDANKGSVNSAGTGDNSNMALWLMLLLASSGAIALTTHVSKKKKYNK